MSGLRIASSWLAGMNKMRWPSFLVWNALGGICWAAGVGLGAYFAGHAFEQVVTKIGVYGAVAIGVLVVALVAVAPPLDRRTALKERGRAIRERREADGRRPAGRAAARELGDRRHADHGVAAQQHRGLARRRAQDRLVELEREVRRGARDAAAQRLER